MDKNSMELTLENKLQGIPWNSKTLHGIPWHYMSQTQTEFHEIPWNSMSQTQTEFHGIPWKCFTGKISMEFHGKVSMEKFRWNSMEFDGIPCPKPRQNSMEFHGEFSMEFHGIPWGYFTRVVWHTFGNTIVLCCDMICC